MAKPPPAVSQEEAPPEQPTGEPMYMLPPLIVDPDGDEVSETLLGGEEDRGEELNMTGTIANLVSVRSLSPGQVELCDSGDVVLRKNDRVVVESERGQVVGTVLSDSVRQVVMDPSVRKVLRRIDHNDVRQQNRNQRKAAEAFEYGKKRAAERGLRMKLIRVDYLHGGNKAVFYFTAEGRIDFRELIKDLARKFRIRVEMRQIGVRDEAGLIGGLGTCGQPLCCNTFLRRFEQISIRMAKDQNLVLNPQKISGQCGRLKCCLVYEHDIYQSLRQGMPKLGKRIMTPKGPGKVFDLDILQRSVKVVLEDGAQQSFTLSELNISEDEDRPADKERS